MNDPTRLQIRLLGDFEVSVDGRVIGRGRWPGRRSSELVQLLALADGHRLTRDQVMEALWPHLSPKAAGANLRKAAHHARRALDRDDAVVLRGGIVSLAPAGSVSTDLAAFEEEARLAIEMNDVSAARRLTDSYQMDLLPESLYEEWTQTPRRLVRARFLELLRLAAQWERIVEIEPTDEAAHRELMRRELARGNRPEVIRWYGRLRSTLATSLGLTPGSETEAIYRQVLGSIEVGTPVLVGRQLELARVEACLEPDGGKGIGAILVRGPAGIGKSALCREILTKAEADGLATVYAAGVANADPYQPLVELLEAVLGRDPELLEAIPPASRSILAVLTPLAGPATPVEGPVSRHRVVGAVRRLLRAAAGAGLVLVVDDAHLIDDATLDVLVNLAGVESGPWVIVLAFRPEMARAGLIEAVSGLVGAGRVLETDLDPLEPELVRSLVAARCPERSDPNVISRIVGLAQGNPFVALELTRCVDQDGSLRVTPTLWEAVRSRFVGLDSGSVAVLQRLAVAGDDLDTTAILAVTGLPEEEAFRVLDAALDGGVLVVVNGRYRFRHDLVRRSLAEQMAPHHQIAIHRDVARRLAEAAGSPALVAEHWMLGGRPDRAVRWLEAAAESARSVGAYADALRHLERLLEADPDHPRGLLMRAETLDALGDLRALSAYSAAAERASEPDVFDILAKRALAQLKAGEPVAALETLEGVDPSTDEGLLCKALTLSGAAAVGVGDPDRAIREATKARRLAFGSGDSGAVVEASWALSLAEHGRRTLPGRLRADLASTQGLPDLAIRVFDGHLCASERLLYGELPYPEVVEFAESLATEAERLGAARGKAFAQTLGGEAKLLSGRLDEAEPDLAEAARAHRSIGATAGEALSMQRLAEVAYFRHQGDEADLLLDEALAVARESYLGHHLLDRIYGAKVRVQSDPEAAMTTLKEGERAVRGPGETCPACRITFVAPAAIAAARAGDLERAGRYADMAESLAEVILRLPGWDAAVSEIRGHVALARGDHPGAVGSFSKAADVYHRSGQPLDEARCRALSRS